MTSNELPAPRRFAVDGSKHLRLALPLITAAALGATLIAGPASAASAAVREPVRTASAQTATLSVPYGGSGLPAASRMTVVRYLYLSDGQLALDTAGARKAGVGSQALRAENARVASLNELLDGNAALAGVSRANVLKAIQALPAAAAGQASTIQLLPGIHLTINSSEIQLSLSKEAVTEIENLAGLGQAIAGLVGGILGLIPIPELKGGAPIAAIVASALGIFSSIVKLCTASDGSATFTLTWPWDGLLYCSGFRLTRIEAR